MQANPTYLIDSDEFWAYVRTISQALGYTDRQSKNISTPSFQDMCSALHARSLSSSGIFMNNAPTNLGGKIFGYFQYRASVLNNTVRPLLMNKNEVEALFLELYNAKQYTCPFPMNKQKGDKKNFAFMTCIVNMIIEQNKGSYQCNYDPRELTTFTKNSLPVKTLSRRVDGAFPSVVDPIAIWEIKEYYYTTTFGSRVADGVYETLVDGMELETLYKTNKISVQHILIVDDYFTWWDCGRSYLCRLVDMLHMGYVNEVIFGKEIISRLPTLVKEWCSQLSSTHLAMR